ncbi:MULTISPECIES: LysR family transcriptional regulator [unclassified Streptomyces]|uniref:LysR family transcriptional regulator n=1 Tax=unclassified Streptomyces TaxID=2593676 RepID=UPI0033FDFEB7
MELRDIEIFLTLSEELHFGRTAERLFISQARVSQAIRKQERLIGAALFERTSRSVRLTPIGDRLAERLRLGHDTIRTALTEATEAARSLSGTLSIGIMGALGHEIRDVVERFRAEHPGREVRFCEVHFSDPFGPLRDGSADLVLLWLPVDEPDLTVGPVLLAEGRVLAVWTGHELAGRDSVDLEDLAGRTVPDPGPGAPPEWRASLLPPHTPGGRPVKAGPRVRTFHELLTQVAAKRAVCPLNAHVQRYYTHPGVEFLPLPDASPTSWALVWRTSGETALIRAFVRAAETTGSRPM